MIDWLLTWAIAQPAEVAVWLVTLVVVVLAVLFGIRLGRLTAEDWTAENRVRALIELARWVEQTCTMNCDAESACVCRSHQRYRKVLAAITGAPQP